MARLWYRRHHCFLHSYHHLFTTHPYGCIRVLLLRSFHFGFVSEQYCLHSILLDKIFRVFLICAYFHAAIDE